MRAKFRRGVGVVVGAMLAVAVMIAVAIYAYSNMQKPPTTTPDPILRFLDSYMSQKIVIGPTATGYYVINAGTSPVPVEYLVLYDNAHKSVAMVKPERGLTCSVTEAVIPPGGLSIVECGSDLTLLAIVSSEGKIFVRDPRLAAPYLIPRAVPQRALLTPEIVSSLEQYIESAEEIRINTSIALTKFDFIQPVPVNLNLELNASLVVALKASSSTETWNILITGYGAYGRRSYSWLKVGGGHPINLSRIGAFRFRIKIENLSISGGGKILVNGSSVSTPRIVPCLVNSGKQCWVSIAGVAGKISVYVNGTSPSTNVDLYPYYITGDLDENGYPEFFFITQDFGVGDKSHANDLVNITIKTTTRVYATDAPNRPIRIVFTGAPINNSKYATAVVSMRLVFWDSSLDDISDNDNRVLLRVGLYDPAARRYVYSVSLSYFELSRYRTVKPMTISYVIKDFLLYIPSVEEVGRRELLIAVDVFDPYDLQRTSNDAEIILGIEYLGLVLGVRI